MDLTIGSRGSKLALTQSNMVADLLKKHHRDLDVKIEIIKTKGDIILDVALSKIGDKGLFVKEIEQALLDGHVDLAIHSLKDMPTLQPHGLKIAAIPEREEPSDVLIAKSIHSLHTLPPRARVATSSLRRTAQLLAARPDLQIEDIRGNVETRLQKFYDSDLDGMILAYAGLKRLGLTEHISTVLSPFELMPAPAQGALALQIRESDHQTNSLLQAIHDLQAWNQATAERAFLQTLEGGCQTPVAAWCEEKKEQTILHGRLLSLDGQQSLDGSLAVDPGNPAQAGKTLAETILQRGGTRILEEIRAIES
ncbi:hydroxymethylbilane synthase [candidate division KSB1 bacterium]|nr:hydroxymethylbilane synthase [candidate division KSB1 bacterium]